MKPAWISVYIFNKISFEKIINELIKPMIIEIGQDNIEKFFFIRYWENGPHIRLRILPKKTVDQNEIAQKIKTFSIAYFDDNDVSSDDYSIDFNQYIREEERYGGKDVMKLTETFFEGSSKTVIKLIAKHHEKWNYSSSISYALQMHLVFAKALFSDHNEARTFFYNTYNNWLYYSVKLIDGAITPDEVKKVISFFEKSYETQKEKISYLVAQLYVKNDCGKDKLLKDWLNSCHDFKNSFTGLKRKGLDLKGANNAESDTISFSILESHIHMTNNRLGVYLRDESFIAFLLFKGMEEFPFG